MSNGPLPTILTFLTLLPTLAPGTKVRFLGCVTYYTLRTGILELQHAYPPSAPPKSVHALVDVNLLLETLKREDTQIGAWVNVIGYVEGVVREAKTRRKDVEEGRNEGPTYVRGQAIMLWSAGGVKLGEYEKALEERLKIGERN